MVKRSTRSARRSWWSGGGPVLRLVITTLAGCSHPMQSENHAIDATPAPSARAAPQTGRPLVVPPDMWRFRGSIGPDRQAKQWDTPETGRFARVHDPERNPIELWEPPG
jgi:hypothetical protein